MTVNVREKKVSNNEFRGIRNLICPVQATSSPGAATWRPSMPKQRLPTPTALESFNHGKALQVVHLPDGKLGVVDEKRNRVWVEYDLQSVSFANIASLPRVDIPSLPHGYGKWLTTSVGGVSSTVRLVNIVRAQTNAKSPITVFAVQAPTESAVKDSFGLAVEGITIGDTEYHDDYKHVTEIIVHAAMDVEYVFARVARAGAVAMLEDPAVDSRRGLGIERLDRINAHVVKDDQHMIGENDDMYGCRRGTENWRYPWLPDGWIVPITWDHMVQNGMRVPLDKLHEMPQPWRQHVATTHLRNGNYPPVGTMWEVATGGVLQAEMQYEQDHQDGSMPPFPLRRLVRFPCEALTAAIRDQAGQQPRPRHIRLQEVVEGVPDDLRTLVCVDGEWYRAHDTKEILLKHVYRGDKRYVSPALSADQSKQLIQTLYLLDVERTSDPTVAHASALVNFAYMKERGYSARWMGKYDQNATHIGNSDSFRQFKRLKQYAPHRLPSDVLNRLMGRDGRVHARGSKGSRSKFKKEGKSFYVPGRRLKRTNRDETKMAAR